MSVKIRLTRMGKKKQPSYRVVVIDERKPRDGAYLEQIGRYDPRQEPSIVEIDNERALDWLQKGAQPTERARKLLEISGAWMQFRVSKGDIHTVGETPAPAAEASSDGPGNESAESAAKPAHQPEVHVVGDPVPDAEEAAAEAADEDQADEEANEAADDATDPVASTDDKEES